MLAEPVGASEGAAEGEGGALAAADSVHSEDAGGDAVGAAVAVPAGGDGVAPSVAEGLGLPDPDKSGDTDGGGEEVRDGALDPEAGALLEGGAEAVLATEGECVVLLEAELQGGGDRV